MNNDVMTLADAHRPFRLMIVDDNEDDVMLLRTMVERVPDVKLIGSAGDGDTAIRMLIMARDGEGPWPDLVLLDLKMPGTDGFDVLTVLRHDPELAQLPIVVLSTSHAEADIARSYALGACSYMTKPLDLETYNQRLRELVEYWTHVCELPAGPETMELRR